MRRRPFRLSLTNSIGFGYYPPALPKIDMWQSFLSRFRNKRLKGYLPVAVLAAAVILTIGATVVLVVKNRRGTTDARVEVAGAKAKQDINRELPLPIRDSKDKEITTIKMILESVELRDEIIVKGKRATSIKGRTFLILNVKLANDYSQPIEVNVKNYFRLTVGGKETELLAADIHNDPVLIQPASTKYTRIGFPINDSDAKLVLWMGEISGEKQKVELTLK